jgi:hypothetical protein
MKNWFVAIALICSLGLVIPGQTLAAGFGIDKALTNSGTDFVCPDSIPNCTNNATPADYSVSGTKTFFLKLLGQLLGLAAIAAVLLLVVAGTRLVLAHGNQEAIQAAHKHILYTLMGLIVIILSLLIVKNVTTEIYKATPPPAKEEQGESGPTGFPQSQRANVTQRDVNGAPLQVAPAN